MATTRHKVTSRQSSLTLSDFLSLVLKTSRKKTKRLLDQRNVFVNRQRVWMAKHVVQIGDIIEVVTPDDADRRKSDIPVLREDDYLLVVNKPPGILAVGTGSVEESLRRTRRSAAVFAVHRLDRDTSGCLLFAKREDILENTVALFRSRRIGKQYHAIVAGRLQTDSRQIRKPVGGKQAVTLIRTLDSNREASHLVARIETGRTHQIRQHLSSVGHPVLGDKRYATSVPVTDRSLSVPRQMLHAARLRFTHPVTEDIVEVEARIPGDFKTCLRSYRLT